LFVAYLPQDKKSLQEELEAHKMYSTLYVQVVQSAYTAFEQAVYQLPKEEVTLTKINGIAKDVTNRFDLHEEDFGLTWTWIPHFYEQAFYCISYCFSNDIAFQLYQEECAQAGNGVSLYIDLIQWNPDQTFLENIRRVGLVDPCDESRITAMRDFLTDYYEDTQLQSAA
jgi:oligoendopeptidase F